MREEPVTVEQLYQSTIDFIYERIDYINLDNIFRMYLAQNNIEEINDSGIVSKFETILDACKGEWLFYYILSFLIHATKRIDLYKKFLENCIADDKLDDEQKYYYYRYLIALLFWSVIKNDYESSEMMDDLYCRVYNNFLNKNIYKFIANDYRDSELYYVMTMQVLSLNHGPTKTVLDRAYILQKYMNKKVKIINTAECNFGIENSVTVFYGVNMRFAYKEDMSELNELRYNYETFSYCQLPRCMSEDDRIRIITDMVIKDKPYCIIHIGGESIINDICSNIVPTITIATVPSDRTQTYGQFQAIGRKLNNDDLKWAKKHGLTREHFIESIFTSAFKEQRYSYKREDLKFPQNAFVTVFVGARLDKEIDNECLSMILRLMEQGLVVVFVGIFDRYEQLKEKYDIFGKQGLYLRMEEDVLAVLECCDLYINPKRIGGGTSVAEALFKKVPVVTMNFGDGGLGAGEEFWVRDYDEMFDMVMKYSFDKEYYDKMCIKAEKRAKVLTDSRGQFEKLINTAIERIERD